MKLNEHQSKLLFSEAKIPVSPGVVASRTTLGELDPPGPGPWAVKALVLTGGRGKAGGVRLAGDKNALVRACRDILSLTVKGEKVPLVRVEPAADVKREFYLSLSVQRRTKSLTLTAGREGGVDIETSGPGNILVQPLPAAGLRPHHVRRAFFHLGLDKPLWPVFKDLVENLRAAVRTYGLVLAEINPLVLTGEDELLALDAKVEIDDNFATINPGLERFFTPEHLDPLEIKARAAGLSFHKLDGFVGMMVNGAGLAMATMDLLNFSGLPAANFLDLGGGADPKTMRAALDILFTDRAAEIVLINIFGGILSCEHVARAMAEVMADAAPPKPVVARFSGHGAGPGQDILASLGYENIHPAKDLESALDILKRLAPKDGARPSGTPQIIRPGPRPGPSAKTPAPPTIPLPGKDTPVLVQGLTGREGRRHAELMLAYGTNVVAGVTPFKGGQTVLGLPVYDTVAEAAARHGAQASVVFVPAAAAVDAVLEAIQAGLSWVVCITEGIPQQDMLSALAELDTPGCRVIGPNTPGLIVPGQTKLGIMPGEVFTPGPVAVLSRSGTLTYETVARLSAAGIGQSVCIGVGGDPFVGTDFTAACEIARSDSRTRAVLVLGEIGGSAEQDLAEHVIKTGYPLPVAAFIAGRTAPPGKRLGHAGAILEGERGIQDKIEAMTRAGFAVCPDLASIPKITAGLLG